MKKRILILEESEPLRQSIVFILAEEGFASIPMSHVAASLEIIQERSVDLLIADLQSSISSGLTLLQPLAGGSTVFPFPVILIHNDLSGAYEITRNMSPGIRFITKPFSRDVLMSAVYSFLNLSGNHRYYSEM